MMLDGGECVMAHCKRYSKEYISPRLEKAVCEECESGFSVGNDG